MNRHFLQLMLLALGSFAFRPQVDAQSQDVPRDNKTEGSAFGSMSVSSQPSEADVYLDNHIAGRTPLILTHVLVGRHYVQLTKDGYCDFSDSLEILPGVEATRAIRMDSACGFVVRSIPDSAAVYLRDIYMGKTPLKINAQKPGWVTLKISKRDYALYQKNVLLEPGKTANIDAQLAPRFGTFTLDSYANDIAISIDGKTYDAVSLHEQMLPAGNHDVIIHRANTNDSIAQSFFLNTGEASRWQIHFGQYTLKRCFLSALLPGMGQISDDASLKGGVMMASFAASTALAIFEFIDYSSKVEDYNAAYNDYKKLTNEDAAKQAGDALIDKHNSLNTSYTLRSVGIIAAASIYIVSIVDALLFHTRENVLEPLSAMDTKGLHPSVVFTPTGARCTLTISF